MLHIYKGVRLYFHETDKTVVGVHQQTLQNGWDIGCKITPMAHTYMSYMLFALKAHGWWAVFWL